MGDTTISSIINYAPKPREWQEKALKIWGEARKGSISVVTGGGKTIFCFMCMGLAMRYTPKLRFLIIVPSLALLDQWVVSFKNDLRVDASDVQVYSGRSQPAAPGVINVCVINSARRLTERLTSEGPWFVCVDECHRAGSPANAKALEGRFVAALGLSATPYRQYDDGFDQFVAPTTGPVVFTYSFEEARRDNVVAPFRLENYRIPFSASEAKQYELVNRAIAQEFRSLKSQSFFDSPKLQLLLRRRSIVVINAKWRVPAAVALAMKYRKPTIIFHERIAAATAIEELVQQEGRRSTAYHSGLSNVIRQRNLALFRNGIVDTLVTCRSLDEGLNIPEAEIGILAASTKSIRQRVQRLGRVLRRSPGKEMAVVCTLYATDSEAEALRQESAALSEIVQTKWYDMSISDD